MDGSLLREVNDTKFEKYNLFVKICDTCLKQPLWCVHTDRDPLTIEFRGIDIGVSRTRPL